MKKKSIMVFVIILGLLGIILLYYMYKKEIREGGNNRGKYIGPISGPFKGRVSYINIIPSNKIECLKRGFYIYLQGIENEDFVILIESIRDSFGTLSENIVGHTFRFERLIECKSQIDGKRAYLLVRPPVMIDDEDKE